MRVASILEKLVHSDNSMVWLYEDLQQYFDKQQLQIIKYKIKGYKNIEIASKLEVCPATITKRMQTIRKKLRSYFKNGSR